MELICLGSWRSTSAFLCCKTSTFIPGIPQTNFHNSMEICGGDLRLDSTQYHRSVRANEKERPRDGARKACYRKDMVDGAGHEACSFVDTCVRCLLGRDLIQNSIPLLLECLNHTHHDSMAMARILSYPLMRSIHLILCGCGSPVQVDFQQQSKLTALKELLTGARS